MHQDPLLVVINDRNSANNKITTGNAYSPHRNRKMAVDQAGIERTIFRLWHHCNISYWIYEYMNIGHIASFCVDSFDRFTAIFALAPLEVGESYGWRVWVNATVIKSQQNTALRNSAWAYWASFYSENTLLLVCRFPYKSETVVMTRIPVSLRRRISVNRNPVSLYLFRNLCFFLYFRFSYTILEAHIWQTSRKIKRRLNMVFYTLRPRRNGRRFGDDTFKHILIDETVRISIKISLKFVPKGPTNNNPALVRMMAWRRSCDKPLSEPMTVSLLTHICITRPQ